MMLRSKKSTAGSLGYYELKQHKPWFDEECKLNCNHHRIQVKQMEISEQCKM
jgi:hypothetical protein